MKWFNMIKLFFRSEQLFRLEVGGYYRKKWAPQETYRVIEIDMKDNFISYHAVTLESPIYSSTFEAFEKDYYYVGR